jgi:hypothetical protein
VKGRGPAVGTSEAPSDSCGQGIGRAENLTVWEPESEVCTVRHTV